MKRKPRLSSINEEIMDAQEESQRTKQGETMWSKGLPKVEGEYYTRVDATDDNPSLIRIEGRAVYEFSGVNLRSVHESVVWEYLGPLSPADTEELLALRDLGARALKYITVEPALDDEGIELAAQLRQALGKDQK